MQYIGILKYRKDVGWVFSCCNILETGNFFFHSCFFFLKALSRGLWDVGRRGLESRSWSLSIFSILKDARLFFIHQCKLCVIFCISMKIGVPFFYIPENQCIIFLSFQMTFFFGQKTSRSGAFWDGKRPTGRLLWHESSHGENFRTQNAPHGEIWDAKHRTGRNLGHEVFHRGGGGLCKSNLNA
jgi:hypothetical protein